MTLFGSHNQTAAALTTENVNTTLNYLYISINNGPSREANTNFLTTENIQIDPNIVQLTPIKLRPGDGEGAAQSVSNDLFTTTEKVEDDTEKELVVPSILLTPCHEGGRNSKEQKEDGANYTGRGNPEITPRRSVVRDTYQWSPSHHLTVTHNPRVRSRSESLTRPYQVPDDLIKRRIQRKLHKTLTKEDTPLSRKRTTSEGDLPHEGITPISPFRCIHAKDDGRHKWGHNPTNVMELTHNLITLDDTKLINNAVSKLLTVNKQPDSACSSPLNRPTAIHWEPEEIEQYQNDLPVYQMITAYYICWT